MLKGNLVFLFTTRLKSTMQQLPITIKRNSVWALFLQCPLNVMVLLIMKDFMTCETTESSQGYFFTIVCCLLSCTGCKCTTFIWSFVYTWACMSLMYLLSRQSVQWCDWKSRPEWKARVHKPCRAGPASFLDCYVSVSRLWSVHHWV